MRDYDYDDMYFDNYHVVGSEAVQAKPLEVKVGNSFDGALRAFRALVQRERVLSRYKEKTVYEKPSDRKRRRRKEAKLKLLEERRKKSDRYQDIFDDE